MKSKRKVIGIGSLLALVMLCCPMIALAAEEAETPAMYATFWALVPAIVAITLALITKEVYSSLFIGILVGALFYSNFILQIKTARLA